MNRLRAWIRSFFGFSRTETNAFLILLPLMAVLIFSEPVYRYWFVRQPQDFSKETKALDSLIATWKWEEPDSVQTTTVVSKLFSFNPNEVTPSELSQLGFDKSISNRIVNYRLKGGKFFVKSDLMRIYGMDTALYRRLLPWINLPEKAARENKAGNSVTREKPKNEKIDLNAADTSQLIKIYGIGPKLSQRIVTYRDKLGGFVSMGQLQEVYGLDSTVIRELTIKFFVDKNFKPKLIDINTATEQQLANHPYFKFKLAKAIAAYRYQHGTFQSIEELKNIVLIDEPKFQQIKPYLSINP